MSNLTQNIQIKSKNVSIWKRLVAFLIDFACFFGVYYALFYSASKPLITYISQDNVVEINQAYQIACDNLNSESYQGYVMIEYEGNYGINNLDHDKYVAFVKEQKPELTEYELEDEYINALGTLESAVRKVPLYQKAYQVFYMKYLIIFSITLLIPAFIFSLLIPLFTPNKSTLGMLCFSFGFANSKDTTPVYPYKILFRFLIDYVALGLIPFLFLGDLTILILLILSLILLLFTKRRFTLTDALSLTKVLPSQWIRKPSLIGDDSME